MCCLPLVAQPAASLSPHHGPRTRRHEGPCLVSPCYNAHSTARRSLLCNSHYLSRDRHLFLSCGAKHAGLSNQAKVLLLGESHCFFFGTKPGAGSCPSALRVSGMLPSFLSFLGTCSVGALAELLSEMEGTDSSWWWLSLGSSAGVGRGPSPFAGVITRRKSNSAGPA